MRTFRRTLSASALGLLLALAVIGPASCGGSGGDSSPLVLIHADFGPDAGRVALNQPIAFLFSRDVDPATVSEDTLLLREAPELAVPARGRFVVEGPRVTFHPDLPADLDLPFGGLRVGATYRVSAPAFPALRTIAAPDGDPLAAPVDATFRAASDLDPPLYVDAAPGPPRVVESTPGAGESDVLVDAAVVLRLDEPIAPKTVGPETIAVLDVTTGISRRVHGSLSLAQDHAGATIVFVATPSLPERATIEVRAEGRLLDLGGNTLVPFAARFSTADSPPRSAALVEEFEDVARLDAADTTAAWAGDGALASGTPPGGDGRDGPFEPAVDTTLDTDLVPEGSFFFSRLVIPAGVTVTILGSRPARLRVYGDATIDGTITVDGGPGALGDNDRAGGAGGPAGPGGARGGDGGCPASDRLSSEGRPGGDRLAATPAPLGGGGVGGSNSTQALGGGGGGGGGFGAPGEAGNGSAPGGGGFATGRPEGPNDDGSIAGGAGGGGGGCDDDFTVERNDGGGSGGGGGGALVIEAGGALALRGVLSARGGDGGESRGQGGAGGGGAGGLVFVRAASVAVEPGAEIRVPGGSGGVSVSEGHGGAGGHGRLRCDGGDGAVDLSRATIVPSAPGVATTGRAPIPGPGLTLGVSTFLDTGVDAPRYSFDGSDPATGLVAGSTNDLVLAGPIPAGTESSLRVEFEGAAGETFDGSIPDLATSTGFLTDVRALDGLRFVRFRVTFAAPPGGDSDSLPPAVDRLVVPYAYD